LPGLAALVKLLPLLALQLLLLLLLATAASDIKLSCVSGIKYNNLLLIMC
jgi:hypothetical protein